MSTPPNNYQPIAPAAAKGSGSNVNSEQSSPEERLYAFVCSKLPNPDDLLQFKILLATRDREFLSRFQDNLTFVTTTTSNVNDPEDEETELSQTTAAATRAESQGGTSAVAASKKKKKTKKKKKKEGHLSYSALRECVKTTMERRARFELLEKSASLSTIDCDGPSKQWVIKVRRCVKEMRKCIENCHDGNRDSFFALPHPLPVTRYMCRCQQEV